MDLSIVVNNTYGTIVPESKFKSSDDDDGGGGGSILCFIIDVNMVIKVEEKIVQKSHQ